MFAFTIFGAVNKEIWIFILFFGTSRLLISYWLIRLITSSWENNSKTCWKLNPNLGLFVFPYHKVHFFVMMICNPFIWEKNFTKLWFKCCFLTSSLSLFVSLVVPLVIAYCLSNIKGNSLLIHSEWWAQGKGFCLRPYQSSYISCSPLICCPAVCQTLPAAAWNVYECDAGEGEVGGLWPRSQ